VKAYSGAGCKLKTRSDLLMGRESEMLEGVPSCCPYSASGGDCPEISVGICSVCIFVGNRTTSNSGAILVES
jgi:hypothetical protein